MTPNEWSLSRERPRPDACLRMLPLYGVPAGAPAICHEKARNEDAVRSMAGSTVEYDCTKSLYTALPLNCANTSTPFGGHATMPERVPFAETEFGPSTAAPDKNGGPFGGVGTRFVTCFHARSHEIRVLRRAGHIPNLIHADERRLRERRAAEGEGYEKESGEGKLAARRSRGRRSRRESP